MRLLKVPKHRQTCKRCPKYPPTLPPLICFLISSPFFVPASFLDCTTFCLFLTRFWEIPKKVLSVLVSCCSHVCSLPKIPPDPSAPLTPLLSSLNLSNSVLLPLIFFYLICFFRLCSCFFLGSCCLSTALTRPRGALCNPLYFLLYLLS